MRFSDGWSKAPIVKENPYIHYTIVKENPYNSLYSLSIEYIATTKTLRNSQLFLKALIVYAHHHFLRDFLFVPISFILHNFATLKQ